MTRNVYVPYIDDVIAQDGRAMWLGDKRPQHITANSYANSEAKEHELPPISTRFDQ